MKITTTYPLFAQAIFQVFIVSFGYGQHISEEKSRPRKGSYLYYGQPRIEDNSMFIEEAFNQEKGIIQHISNLLWSNHNSEEMLYSYTEEIPIVRDQHQFSFTLNFPINRTLPTNEVVSGFGDLLLNYRYLLCDKNDLALVVPKFSLVVPTGNKRITFGEGAWGGQLAIAVTKRLNRKITSHLNAGYLYLIKADRYFHDASRQIGHHERNIDFVNLGVSSVYMVTKGINLMAEGTANFNSDIMPDGRVVNNTLITINPAFRFGFDIGNVQIVPGVGVPFFFLNGKHQSTGSFFYLSIEPDHTR